ncbi:MAG: helix-turn-helix domain-containing protein [Alphaproteobacteria bacterium]
MTSKPDHGSVKRRTEGGRLTATYTIKQGLKAPRRGKPDQVVIPFEDFEALREAAEDRADLAAHQAVMANLDPKRLIPLEVVKAEIMGSSAIKAWRKYRGLTLVQLAEKCGLSQPYLSQLENGQKEATTGTLRKLAKALGTDPGNLI